MEHNKPKGNSVYLFLHPLGYTKIGVSGNVDRRLMYIQQSSPFEIFCLGSRRVSKAYELESYLHKQYARYRCRSEWFKLSVPKIREILDFLELPHPDILVPFEELGGDLTELVKNGYEPSLPKSSRMVFLSRKGSRRKEF